MHLLQAQPGAVADGSQAVDLGQTPADLVFLSAADSELAVLVRARDGGFDDGPSRRLANLMQLSHPMSVDLYVDRVIAGARLVVARLPGGVGYWPYGVERVAEVCAEHGVLLALLPGDDQPDAELRARSTVGAEDWHRLWQFWVHGGLDNARAFLGCCVGLLGHGGERREPAPLARAGLYWPGETPLAVDDRPSSCSNRSTSSRLWRRWWRAREAICCATTASSPPTPATAASSCRRQGPHPQPATTRRRRRRCENR